MEVNVLISVVVSRLAGMETNLLVRQVIVVTVSSWTRDVAAVDSVIPDVTETKTIVAGALEGAVIDAVEQIEIPHVGHHRRGVRVGQIHWLLGVVSHAAIHYDLTRLRLEDGAMTISRKRLDKL